MRNATQEPQFLADLVETSISITQYRESLLDLLDREVGFDLACTQSTADGRIIDFTSRAYDRTLIESRLSECMGEFQPQELSRFVGHRFTLDTECLSVARREQLGLYREFMKPNNVQVLATHLWRSRFGVFGVQLARSGRGAKFTSHERARLDWLAPQLELAELAWACQPKSAAAERNNDDEHSKVWAHRYGVSTRELQVACLVARGLTNKEIGMLCGSSVHTVRNQLSTVFRKVNVSTRAELVFCFLHAGSPECGVLPRHRPLPWFERVPGARVSKVADDHRAKAPTAHQANEDV